MSSPESYVMPFGKYQGQELGQILADDPTYLDWLRDAEIRSDALREAVTEMCEKYAAEIDRAVEARGG